MKTPSRRKTFFAALALTALAGASFAAWANNCDFAYSYCMPRYYSCLASGTSQITCHQALDACLIRNGCGNLP